MLFGLLDAAIFPLTSVCRFVVAGKLKIAPAALLRFAGFCWAYACWLNMFLMLAVAAIVGKVGLLLVKLFARSGNEFCYDDVIILFTVFN